MVKPYKQFDTFNGRYKTWEFIVEGPSIDHPIDYSALEELATFVFDSKFKLLRVEPGQYTQERESGLQIICIIIGKMTKRRRFAYIKNKVIKFVETHVFPSDYNYVFEPANNGFEKAGPGEIFTSSEDASEYKGTDIELLDLYSNRHPWQKDLFKKIYDESIEEFIPSNDRTVIWIYDGVGRTGKSKFMKWICMNRPEDVAKITFGTASQLRSSIISAGPKKCYFLDLPRTISNDNALKSILEAIENIKNGHIVSNMYGRSKSLLMDPPHILIFANIKCPEKSLSEDRLEMYEILAKELTLKRIKG